MPPSRRLRRHRAFGGALGRPPRNGSSTTSRRTTARRKAAGSSCGPSSPSEIGCGSGPRRGSWTTWGPSPRQASCAACACSWARWRRWRPGCWRRMRGWRGSQGGPSARGGGWRCRWRPSRSRLPRCASSSCSAPTPPTPAGTRPAPPSGLSAAAAATWAGRGSRGCRGTSGRPWSAACAPSPGWSDATSAATAATCRRRKRLCKQSSLAC
mmetsp:Transcript_41081/g.85751  ORF Transcript_41081/g.85751 Transcript_41081/m.85751 type:complete len:211 (+) Transcript_41081:630-1262(+)